MCLYEAVTSTSAATRRLAGTRPRRLTVIRRDARPAERSAAGRGLRAWRAARYGLAQFPVAIHTSVSAVDDVVPRRSRTFAVTTKTGPGASGPRRDRIRPQPVAMVVLAAAAILGLVRVVVADAAPLAAAVNVAWVASDLAVMSVVVTAARCRGFRTEKETL